MHAIAEGFDAGLDKEFIDLLVYARRSTTEDQSQFHIALDQRYVTTEMFNELANLAEQR